jgi:4-amino-4-deoxy-L-arabinose transferase-like glycosyltransferase
MARATSPYTRVNTGASLAALGAIAIVARALLVWRAPTSYGYVYDFYHEAIQRFYATGRLPASTDCWQCYHPPLHPLLGLPLYALGKKLVGGPVGLADPALRFVAILSVVCGAAVAFYSYRLLRLFRIRGAQLIVGTGLVLSFPCLFISSYGIEADILLSAIMTAFTYYAVKFFALRRHANYRAAAGLGVLAGLACATKYSGLAAPVVLVVLTGFALADGPPRMALVRHMAVALLACVVIGSWPYVNNVRRYHTPLFANGSAQQGFAISARPNYVLLYDFGSLRIRDLLRLADGRVRPGPLTDRPFYRSVWTTLHAMAWSDMSMFSDPSRHGFAGHPYPRKVLNRTLVSSVLVLALVPDALALLGFFVTFHRRALRAVTATCMITGASYVSWFVSQDSWGLKTKYILFLLPCYVLYSVLGWRWLERRSPMAGRLILALLALLLIAANLYLFDFAWS